jgi:dTDP-4-dehydrorhamnose 3,5-epimerase
MEIESLDIDAVKLIRPRRHADRRGYFVESWNRRTFAGLGIDIDFVQDNSSFSVAPGTIRGLHFQTPPRAQAKLVRVVHGSALDVAVDLRRGSPTFGRSVAVVLTAEKGEQLFIPVGFAHGFCTLEPATELSYKVSDFYSSEHDSGIAWDDPELAIEWPLDGREPVLSDKDRALRRLNEIRSPF